MRTSLRENSAYDSDSEEEEEELKETDHAEVEEKFAIL